MIKTILIAFIFISSGCKSRNQGSRIKDQDSSVENSQYSLEELRKSMESIGIIFKSESKSEDEQLFTKIIRENPHLLTELMSIKYSVDKNAKSQSEESNAKGQVELILEQFNRSAVFKPKSVQIKVGIQYAPKDQESRTTKSIERLFRLVKAQLNLMPTWDPYFETGNFRDVLEAMQPKDFDFLLDNLADNNRMTRAWEKKGKRNSVSYTNHNARSVDGSIYIDLTEPGLVSFKEFLKGNFSYFTGGQ